ncbi:MAG TPA: hypothetical protein VNZ45_10585 [Bacteroidia bacterium]|jgi:hypothetical protein|nr:hypothetical protein [Bacteroidia bacterium]
MSLEPQRRTKAFGPVEQGSGIATKQPNAVHHEIFTYPLKPKPNPALSSFFEKLEQLKKDLING